MVVPKGGEKMDHDDDDDGNPTLLPTIKESPKHMEDPSDCPDAVFIKDGINGKTFPRTPVMPNRNESQRLKALRSSKPGVGLSPLS